MNSKHIHTFLDFFNIVFARCCKMPFRPKDRWCCSIYKVAENVEYVYKPPISSPPPPSHCYDLCPLLGRPACYIISLQCWNQEVKYGIFLSVQFWVLSQQE